MLEIVVVVIEGVERQIRIGLGGHEVHLGRGAGLTTLHFFYEVRSGVVVCSFISCFIKGIGWIDLQCESRNL